MSPILFADITVGSGGDSKLSWRRKKQLSVEKQTWSRSAVHCTIESPLGVTFNRSIYQVFNNTVPLLHPPLIMTLWHGITPNTKICTFLHLCLQWHISLCVFLAFQIWNSGFILAKLKMLWTKYDDNFMSCHQYWSSRKVCIMPANIWPGKQENLWTNSMAELFGMQGDIKQCLQVCALSIPMVIGKLNISILTLHLTSNCWDGSLMMIIRIESWARTSTNCHGYGWCPGTMEMASTPWKPQKRKWMNVSTF